MPTKEEKAPRTLEDDDETRTSTFVVLNIFIWAGSYVLVRLLHVLCFRWGWLQSPGSTSMEDFFLVAVLARGIAAELQWSDMKRKHGRREKDIMM